MLAVVLNSLFSSPTIDTLSDDALESVLVPLDGLGLVDAVRGANLALAPPTLGNTLARAGHADVEVHAVDTAPVSECLCHFLASPHTQCSDRT
jgi:hypothetical protein